MTFFLYSLIQFVFVMALTFFAYPPLSSFLVPLMTNLFGEYSVHYPNNFLVMPSMFFWINIVISGFLGIVMVGTATRLFSRDYDNKSVKLMKGLKGVWPHYAALLLVWLIETALLLGVLWVLPPIFEELSLFARYNRLVGQVITTLISIVIGSLFVYTSALVVLDGEGTIGAIISSLKLFLKYPVVTVMLLGIPYLIKMPIDMLSTKSEYLIATFNPEMVAGVIVMGIFLSVFTNFILVGSVTRYFLFAKEA